MAQAGIDKTGIALLTLIPGIIGMISRVPITILSRKIKHYKVIPFIFLIQLISLFSYFLINDSIWFYPIVSFSALAWSIFGPIALSLIEKLSPKHMRGKILGWYYTMSGVGRFVGPLILSLLTLYIPLRFVFLTASVFPVIGIFFAIVPWGKITNDFSFLLDEKENSSDYISDSVQKSLLRIISNKKLVFLFMCRILFFFAITIFRILFALYLNETLGYSPFFIGLLFSLYGIMNFITRLPMGIICDRIGRKCSFLITYIVMILGFFLISLDTTILIIGIGMALIGSSQGMAAPVTTILFHENVDERDRLLALSIYLTNMEIGTIISSIFVSIFIKTMSVLSMFAFSAIILIFAIFIFMIGFNTKNLLIKNSN